MMRGGFSGDEQMNDRIVEIANSVRNDIETKAGMSFAQFTPIKYRSQIVAGTNYSIKIRITDNEYIHVVIFEALSCYGGNIEVHKVNTGKTLEDSL
jgi:hypothetical protein